MELDFVWFISGLEAWLVEQDKGKTRRGRKRLHLLIVFSATPVCTVNSLAKTLKSCFYFGAATCGYCNPLLLKVSSIRLVFCSNSSSCHSPVKALRPLSRRAWLQELARPWLAHFQEAGAGRTSWGGLLIFISYSHLGFWSWNGYHCLPIEKVHQAFQLLQANSAQWSISSRRCSSKSERA